MTHDWLELQAQAVPPTRDGALEDLVRALDIAWVATAKVGIELTEDAGRLVGKCPFHEDSDPSFAIFWVGDGKARWGCWSCPDTRGGVGTHGDVIDLIARWRGVGVVAAIGYARVYLREYEHAGSPTTVLDGLLDVPHELSDEARAWFARSRTPAATTALLTLAAHRMWTWLAVENASRIVACFALGAHERQLIAPYYDDFGTLVAIKSRDTFGQGPWRAARGSRLATWYRSHSGIASGIAVVCEGESDTWAAWSAGYDAFGLPAGVSSARTMSLDALLTARRVVIALDGDEAGYRATETLCQRLIDASERRMTSGPQLLLPLIRPLAMPAGSDLASLGPQWIVATIGRE